MLKTFGLPIIFVLDDRKAFQAHPFLGIRACFNFYILAQEGPRDFLNTPKCSQCSHLYKTYEATYALKSKIFEIWPKNHIFAIGSTVFLRIFVYWHRKVVETIRI